MIKRGVYLLVGVAMLLAACQPSRPSQVSSFAATGAPPTQAAPLGSTPRLTAALRLTATPSGSPVPPGCTVVSRNPAPGPTQESRFPAVNAKDWQIGPEDARVTIVEYSDFMCPGCAGLEPVMALLEQNFPADLRVVYRHFPLTSIHDKAALSAQAAEAAGLQGKFWEMHDQLFSRQKEWEQMDPQQFETWLAERAGELKLDVERFKSDLNSPALVKQAQDAWDQGVASGMPGTPFLLVDGEIYSGPLSYANLEAIIQLKLLADKQFDTCPPMQIDSSKQYQATIKTEKGDIVLELLAEDAPMAVNNFIFLAQHGWFDGTTFHRVVPGFVAQAGDPTGTSFGSPGYAFDNEIVPGLKFDKPGMVGMANAGPGTNGSQFFITMAPTPDLDGKYTIFGRVIAGMDVVEKLKERNPSQSLVAETGDKIFSVVITEK